MNDVQLDMVTIVDTFDDPAETEDPIVIVTPEPTQEYRETVEATPMPSYSPDTLLLAENQVNVAALETALVGLVLGFVLGVEVLKIWLTGSR